MYRRRLLGVASGFDISSPAEIREALLKECKNRSGLLMEMMNERNMLNGAHGDY